MSILIRITFSVPEEQGDLLTAFLYEHVSHGWAENISPNGVISATIHLPADPVDPATSDSHGLSAVASQTRLSLIDSFTKIFPDGLVHHDSVEEENWVEAWKEFFTPVQGGEHFYVLAPWMEEERKNTPLIPIIIEPKTAFGTGHHGSTSLCLDVISDLYGQGIITNETSFLDLGTGSGILGIACAKLGLRGTGLDMDPIAIENAIENRALNNINPDQFTLACGTQDQANGTYDLVIANILAGPLQEMAPRLIEILGLAPTRGHLILSGILETQASAVAETYVALGMPQPQIRIKGEWASLYFAPHL